MNVHRIPAYARACVRALVRNRPRDYLRMLSTSPYTVQSLPGYGVSMLVDTRDPAISKPILALGQYERHLTERLLSFVQPETRFLDIGANIGFFSLLVGARCTQGKVWSFEPDPGNYRLLCANVALNGLEDVVETHHAALSDREETLYFSSLGHDRNLGARFTAKESHTLKERAVPGTPDPVEIQAHAVDSFLAGQRIDLVKIDVEGFEPAVFRGMRGMLETQRPVVITEFAPGTIRHISGSDPLELLRLVDGMGYGISVIEADGTVSRLGGGENEWVARFPEGSAHHLDLILEPK